MATKHVSFFPLRIFVEQNIQAPWHIAAVGLPVKNHDDDVDDDDNDDYDDDDHYHYHHHHAFSHSPFVG